MPSEERDHGACLDRGHPEFPKDLRPCKNNSDLSQDRVGKQKRALAVQIAEDESGSGLPAAHTPARRASDLSRMCASASEDRMIGAALIRRMAEGDRDAFARFYDQYARQVYPLVLRIVRDPADAAGVLQDVFWEAWQAAPAYDPGRGTPEAWIFVRARTRAIDRVRAVRRRSETERAGNRDFVLGALGRLPEAQREVLELAYYGGLTQTEIAERLKQPLGTVKTRLRLGLERLREVVQRPQ